MQSTMPWLSKNSERWNQTSQLSESELDDLVTYLETL